MTRFIGQRRKIDCKKAPVIGFLFSVRDGCHYSYIHININIRGGLIHVAIRRLRNGIVLLAA
ncbi:MAG: hypothetical protein U0Z17_01530 [Bacteroidales bacterium]